MSSKLPRCECCGRSFHPDPGNISRQKFCKYPDCVLERKRLHQHKWYGRKRAEDAEFRAHENARCREANQRRRAAARSPDPPGPATLLLTSSVLPEVPTGQDAASFVPDPWLVAGKLAPDAVIAYRSAFQFHGRAYSVSGEVVFPSGRQVRSKECRGYRFRRVAHPQALRRAGEEDFGVATADRQGMDVRVTSFERSLVDVLDRPDLGGGWEEIWRSAESVEYYDVAAVVKYTLLLRNATTAAKVGFFLEQHSEQFSAEAGQLAELRAARPRQPHYMDVGTPGRIEVTWSLIVPETILTRAWEAER